MNDGERLKERERASKWEAADILCNQLVQIKIFGLESVPA